MVNQDDNTIVQFVIGNDGKLYPQNTVNTPGVFPLAVAVTGSNLFVAGYLPAAAKLLHRGAVLGLDCRLSHRCHDLQRRGRCSWLPAGQRELELLAAQLTGKNASDVLLPTALTVLTRDRTVICM